MSEICLNITSGGTPNTSQKEYYMGNIPWLRTQEVDWHDILDTDMKISEEGLKKSSAKMIPINCVIVAMYGATAAKVAINKIPLCTNQACCNMITNSFEEAAYLYFHCMFKQGNIKRLANGGAQENLSQELICAQPIIICNNIQDICMFANLLRTKITYAKEICELKQLLSIYLSKLINS